MKQPTAREVHVADLRRRYRVRAALVRTIDPSLAEALMDAERDAGTEDERDHDLDLLWRDPRIPPLPTRPAVSWDLQVWQVPGQQ